MDINSTVSVCITHVIFVFFQISWRTRGTQLRAYKESAFQTRTVPTRIRIKFFFRFYAFASNKKNIGFRRKAGTATKTVPSVARPRNGTVNEGLSYRTRNRMDKQKNTEQQRQDRINKFLFIPSFGSTRQSRDTTVRYYINDRVDPAISIIVGGKIGRLFRRRRRRRRRQHFFLARRAAVVPSLL